MPPGNIPVKKQALRKPVPLPLGLDRTLRWNTESICELGHKCKKIRLAWLPFLGVTVAPPVYWNRRES
jgi:hypothetical protein